MQRLPDRELNDPRHAAAVRRLRSVARVWDDLVRLPVIGRRIGLDAIIGLVPGIGDVAGALVASWGIVVAATLRAPAAVLLRMLLNIGLDTLIGVIPLLGDVFDIGWHAQQRNVALLDRWLAMPEHVARHSGWVVLGVAVGLVGVFVATLWLAVTMVSRLFGAL